MTAEADHDTPECAVFNIEHARPAHAARVKPAGRIEVQFVVDEGRKQVVRARDRVQVAREVQVDVVGRNDLRAPAPGAAPLRPEHRAQRWLAQGDDGVPPQPAHRHRERDRDGRLALAAARRGDRRDQH